MKQKLAVFSAVAWRISALIQGTIKAKVTSLYFAGGLSLCVCSCFGSALVAVGI
jgi:hypothetical protein